VVVTAANGLQMRRCATTSSSARAGEMQVWCHRYCIHVAANGPCYG
jgi:hypothetical protein